MYVNHNWNTITIFWKSKRGKDVLLHHTDMEYDDVEFWFGELETALYLKQLYPKDNLPFKPDKLRFDEVITRITPPGCSLNIKLLLQYKTEVNSIIDKLDHLVGDFNINSEKNYRKYGVIHNTRSSIINESNFLYEFDLGSAGVMTFKKLFRLMNEMKCFKRVEIE